MYNILICDAERDCPAGGGKSKPGRTADTRRVQATSEAKQELLVATSDEMGGNKCTIF